MTNDKTKTDKGRVITEIKTLFEKEAGEVFDDEYLDEIKTNPPEEPHFPYLILMAAISKDVIDGLLTATLLGAFFSWFFSLFLGLIIFMWLMGKLGIARKMLLRWGIKRAGLTIIIESIPFLAVIPTATIFVVLAHNRERKIIQLFFLALEKLQKGGI
ncbi:MAG: hypothetical protein KJI72_02185 [Patescibacteria group bacterium]|nr:hypothetical protein [Patescibacteria group bacterium]